MKNLITLLIVLISLTGNSQKFKQSDKFYFLDSTNLPYIESLIAERVNMYRKEKGLQPLIWNDTLKPGCDHHQYYMTHSHDMSHEQTIDLPNFDELAYPSSRSLLNMFNYAGIREELTSDMFNLGEKGMVFKDYVTRQIEGGFKKSSAHWSALMDPELDYIYVDVMNGDPNLKSDEIQYYGGTFTMIVMCENFKNPSLCSDFYSEKPEYVEKYKNNPYSKTLCFDE